MVASAVVTGAGSGIGRSLAISLGKRGFALSLLDLSQQGLDETAASVRDACPGAVLSLSVLDVRDAEAQEACFQDHMRRYGR
jgi:NADP-dependent 3-hydroxy acid dehydrogenase YdfG